MFLLGGNMRSKDRDKYEDDWLRLCAQLAPVIRQSLEINRTISGLTFEKWAAEQHLMGSGTAIFVIDTAMRIHYACAEAQKLHGLRLSCRLWFRQASAFPVRGGSRQVRWFRAASIHGWFRCVSKPGRQGMAEAGTWTCRSIGLQLGDLDKTPFRCFHEQGGLCSPSGGQARSRQRYVPGSNAEEAWSQPGRSGNGPEARRRPDTGGN